MAITTTNSICIALIRDRRIFGILIISESWDFWWWLYHRVLPHSPTSNLDRHPRFETHTHTHSTNSQFILIGKDLVHAQQCLPNKTNESLITFSSLKSNSVILPILSVFLFAACMVVSLLELIIFLNSYYPDEQWHSFNHKYHGYSTVSNCIPIMIKLYRYTINFQKKNNVIIVIKKKNKNCALATYKTFLTIWLRIFCSLVPSNCMCSHRSWLVR